MLQIYEIKRYFWSTFGVIGIVLFWAGVWDGIGSLPYLENPLISLIVGLLIFSGLIFKEFDPHGKNEKGIIATVHHVHKHPNKHLFSFKYFDKIKNKHTIISAENLERIEKDLFLVFRQAGNEVFIPLHRIKDTLHKGKSWSLDHNN